ncbi:MAG: hypothetical protein QM783_03410 [Phycisphaerales bacterium]
MLVRASRRPALEFDNAQDRADHHCRPVPHVRRRAAQPPAEQPGGGTGSIGFQSVAAAHDKAGKKIEPPTLNLKSEEGAVWPMIATLVIILACGLVGAAIPPKRGHQD